MSRNPAPPYDFSLSPLDADDRRIVEGYESVGRSVDDLPYTADFDRLVAMLDRPETDDARHHVFKRLLALRKRGRLPGNAPAARYVLDSIPSTLDVGDQRLVEAYESIGRPVDDLPYTADFDRLVATLSRPMIDDARHQIFRRLIALRKRGQLPRVYRPISSSGS